MWFSFKKSFLYTNLTVDKLLIHKIKEDNIDGTMYDKGNI